MHKEPFGTAEGTWATSCELIDALPMSPLGSAEVPDPG